MANIEDLVAGFPQAQEYVPSGSKPPVWWVTRSAAAALIADSGKTFVVGERMEYTDPLPGGNLCTVCTTAGAGGGTAMFYEAGVIEAP